MVSTQNLIMVLIAINLCVGMGLHAENNPDVFEFIDTDTENQQGEEINEYLQAEETNRRPSATTQLEDASKGNALTMGGQIFNIFLDGLSPFPIKRDMVDTQIEKMLVTLLNFFKYLMWALILIELYMVYKNKKVK